MSMLAVSGMEVSYLSRPSEIGKKACMHAYTQRAPEMIIAKEGPESLKGKGTPRQSNIVKIKTGGTEDEKVVVVESDIVIVREGEDWQMSIEWQVDDLSKNSFNGVMGEKPNYSRS